MKKKIMALLCAAAMMLTTVGIGTTALAEDDDEWHLAICIHSMDNEAWAAETYAAELFGSGIDNLSVDVLTCDSDDNKQLQGINDYISQYGDKAIFVVDPSSTANTSNIVETCEENGNYVVLLYHRTEDLYPQDFEYLVSILMMSDVENSYKTACALFDAMGGEGEVAELEGPLADDSAVDRHTGFQMALEEYPDITCVDTQVADWDQANAMTITEDWIVNYPDLKAVYSGNDDMALGAIEALRNNSLNGEVLVCGCDGTSAGFDAVMDGDMYCTIYTDPYCIAGYGCAYCYYAATGEYDYQDVPDDETMFYTNQVYVDASNADDIYQTYLVDKDPGYDYSDLSFPVASYFEE